MAVKPGSTPNQGRVSPGLLWATLAAVVVALLAVVSYWALPGARLVPQGSGVARVSLSGLDARVASAHIRVNGRLIPLRYQQGALVPTTKLAPEVVGQVDVTVQGASLLRFLPWDTRNLALVTGTPAVPKVTQRVIHRGLNSGLTIHFREPVSAVTYTVPGGRTHHLTLSVPSRRVVLPLPAPQPGQKGSVSLWARSRSWESSGSATTIRWVSVPYLTAKASASKANPTGSLLVTFSEPIVTPHLSQWVLSPAEAGSWREVSPTEFAFTASQPGGFGPGAVIRVTIPGKTAGPQASSGSVLAASTVLRWTTPPGSVERLQELLAEEGYLPVGWTPAQKVADPTLAYEDSTIYNPPAGQFRWLYPQLPAKLQTLWTPGQLSVVTQGAIMQFEAVNGLPIDGVAGPQVWRALIADRLDGKVNPHPYTYIYVTETEPETLELWVGNQLFLKTLTNTGIPATPTFLGTFPIYERLPFQIMRGKNPDGIPYADPVYWINYFAGGDAVHGFVRASYGFPQSLGCVEVPTSIAPTIYHTVNYGTLVTVNPVGVPPAPGTVKS